MKSLEIIETGHCKQLMNKEKQSQDSENMINLGEK